MAQSSRSTYLLVERGPDTGASLTVGSDCVMIGRASGADLQLTDPCVSRRHIEVTLSDGQLELRCCDGTQPFLISGQPLARAVVKPGDRILVGDTVLRVVESVVPLGPPSSRRVEQASALHTLLGGPTLDVRGLAAVFALVESLDQVGDETAVREVVEAWAQRYADAASVEFGNADGDQLRQAPDSTPCLVMTTNGHAARSRAVISAPIHWAPGGSLTFTLTISPDQVSDSVRHLLVVGARLCASRLANIQILKAVVHDRDALRAGAVGSARSFLGSSPAAQRTAALIGRVAAVDTSILLTGETGTGKTFAARLIHESGSRAAEPFRVINCAAIPENLIESELFGVERGAFTGAVVSRPGALEAAGRGTILLDEIGELPHSCQAKLLRVVEERGFERVGSTRSIPLRARILAATNRELEAMIARGKFRQDLFFRIAVMQVRIPPLRERAEDIVDLATLVLQDLRPMAGRRIEGFAPAAKALLQRCPWPGNVRELRNAIEHAIVLGEGPVIQARDFPAGVVGGGAALKVQAQSAPLATPASEVDAAAIHEALRAAGGNRTRAAALLGVGRTTLYRKLQELGIDDDSDPIAS